MIKDIPHKWNSLFTQVVMLYNITVSLQKVFTF